MTHLIITNRQPAELAGGWIHIVPRGELPNREAGLTQVLDDPALDSILASLRADAARLGPKWPGLYLGEEHFIYNDAQSSAALAWAKEFEKRADGIWARPEFTDLGKAAIENRRFKFTSFVADRRHTQDLGNGRVRILKIDTVGFTNQANGKELLTPVCNRAALSRDAATDFADAGASAANQPQPKNQTMKKLAMKLGLAAEASADAILAEVTKLQNRADTAEASAQEVPALKNRLAVLDGEQVDTLLAEHGIKDEKQLARLKPALLPLKNRGERVEYLTDLGFKPGAQRPEAQGRILNRGELKPAPGQPTVADERALAEKTHNRAREIQAVSKIGFDAAHAQAARELIKN